MRANLIERVLLPPTSTLILIAIGLIVSPFSLLLGLSIATLGFVAISLSSSFLLADYLMTRLQGSRPDNQSLTGVQAIVILGGKPHQLTQGTDDDPVSRFSMARVRHTASLAHQSNLPVLATGGRPGGERDSEASLIAEELSKNFNVPTQWLEENSGTTWENARFSYDILRQHNINHIAVVTHAWHMPRARYAFEYFGFKVTAAPTAFHENTPSRFLLDKLLPNAYALLITRLALHEFLGNLWYRYRKNSL